MDERDPSVVARARDGDRDAFRLLVETHSRYIYSLAHRMTDNAQDAEDVVQDAWLKAHKQLSRFEARADFRTWLHRITVNCSIDLIRARRHREDAHDPADLEQGPLGDVGAEAQPTPERVAASTQISDRVNQALSLLTALERAAFTLRHVEGMSIEEAWARLEPHLDSNQSALRRFFWFPQWALAGGVAALLVAAFWAGRISGGDVGAPAVVAEAGEMAPERVLQATVGDHLDRTQMMLVELANADTDGADVLAGEQERAVDLVAANRLIRQSAMRSGNAQIVDILEDLERVLLEVANAPADVTSNDLTDLQSRITREDLLFRLRVIASEMRQRTLNDRATGDPNLRRTPRS